MVYIYLFLIVFSLCILCFYTKYNIKTITSGVEKIIDIAVYTLSVINIGICVWALFGIIK